MKLGMTFEGGASRTVFSCGVADAFLEEDLMPDYFIGVSAGIAFGISYLSKQKGRNLRLAREYMPSKQYQGAKYLLDRKKKTFYNVEYVFGEVPNKLLPFDYDAFAAYPGKVVAVVTNIHTGEAEYLEVPRDSHDFEVVLASCSLPVLFQPVKIGHHYYLDGGIADSIPYRQAMKEGCDKNIVVLTRERGYVKRTDQSAKVSAWLYQRYPKIAQALRDRAENYNRSMEELAALEREGKVFVIAPDTTYGMSRTESDPVKLEQLYEEGYLKAKEQMVALKNYLKA
ncbi:MAG: patatin family protein [Lachnospiraceae bacterium]|nr:patatin family protein [Lachnospiraceae bacterium]